MVCYAGPTPPPPSVLFSVRYGVILASDPSLGMNKEVPFPTVASGDFTAAEVYPFQDYPVGVGVRSTDSH